MFFVLFYETGWLLRVMYDSQVCIIIQPWLLYEIVEIWDIRDIVNIMNNLRFNIFKSFKACCTLDMHNIASIFRDDYSAVKRIVFCIRLEKKIRQLRIPEQKSYQRTVCIAFGPEPSNLGSILVTIWNHLSFPAINACSSFVFTSFLSTV